jgi:putative heme iron utilization protein
MDAAKEAKERRAEALKRVEATRAAAIQAENEASEAVLEVDKAPQLCMDTGYTRLPTWDVYVSVHCVKATGKSAGRVEYDVEAQLLQNHEAQQAQEATIEECKAALQRAIENVLSLKEQLKQAELDEIAAHGALDGAQMHLTFLLDEQAELISGEWHAEWMAEQRAWHMGLMLCKMHGGLPSATCASASKPCITQGL